ncbi:hypothetical protein EVAR_19443_1 [Eumeta japonica]|uniref:Uncharacterized protein n=1 Tax=Eumeta variegata TaxID=151549 RepID=A0A4C1TRW5_EUMVA|nr:hypothetical protein EVAR_19443_1 [Eumeta japonica]
MRIQFAHPFLLKLKLWGFDPEPFTLVQSEELEVANDHRQYRNEVRSQRLNVYSETLVVRLCQLKISSVKIERGTFPFQHDMLRH